MSAATKTNALLDQKTSDFHAIGHWSHLQDADPEVKKVLDRIDKVSKNDKAHSVIELECKPAQQASSVPGKASTELRLHSGRAAGHSCGSSIDRTTWHLKHWLSETAQQQPWNALTSNRAQEEKKKQEQQCCKSIRQDALGLMAML